MKKEFYLFCLLCFNTHLFSQTSQLFETQIGLQYIYTLSSNNSSLNILLDSVIEKSKDCLFITERYPYYFEIYSSDSSIFLIQLNQLKSYDDFKVKFENLQSYGFNFSGMIYKNNLFLINRYKNHFFDEDTTLILKLDNYFSRFKYHEQYINSITYFDDLDIDEKRFYITLINNKYFIEHSTPCIQVREDVPLIPYDAIHCYNNWDKRFSIYDITIHSPFTDKDLIGSCVALLQFEGINSFKVENVIGLQSLHIKKMVTDSSGLVLRYDRIITMSPYLDKYSKDELEQIDYYKEQLLKLIPKLNFYLFDKEYINQAVGKNQPVEIRFSICPLK